MIYEIERKYGKTYFRPSQNNKNKRNTPYGSREKRQNEKV